MINSNSRSNNSNTSNKDYNDDKKINVVVEDDHPLTIINKEDSNFQLSFLPSSSLISSTSISIAIITTTSNNKNSNMERYKVRTTRYFKRLNRIIIYQWFYN